MSERLICLQVLVVEDDEEAMMQFSRDIPPAFQRDGVDAKLHPCSTFEEAYDLVNSPVHRYDLVISDTYKGDAKKNDVGVEGIISAYQNKRFCPLVIYSSGVKPDSITESPFLRWVDKSERNGIEKCIKEILNSGIPQLARQLHDELDGTASEFLWMFLIERWGDLNHPTPLGAHTLERIIRRRAAIQLGDLDPMPQTDVQQERAGAEYYIYPPLDQSHFSLGDILRKNGTERDLFVILTPHCYLAPQVSKSKPKADFVLLAKVMNATAVLGDKKIENAKKSEEKMAKKLSSWSQSPSRDVGTPDGRYWYLPAFLDIPHAFCDFLQVSSEPISKIDSDYQRVATLLPPYSEALQSCFAGFYSSVGIPTTSKESIESLLKE